MFGKLKNKIVAAVSYRRTVTELSSLSDAELNDIGLCRGDIHTLAKRASQGL